MGVIIRIERILGEVPSRVVVAVAQGACGSAQPFGRFQSLELAHGIADIQLIVHLGSLHTLGGTVLVLVFEIAVEEQSLTLVVTKVAIEFHAHVAVIFAELLHGHAQLVLERFAVGGKTGRGSIFGVVVAGLALAVIEVIAGTGRHGPPVGVTLILPVGVAGVSGESEDDLVAVVVVPVEGGIPTVGHRILAIVPVDNLLCHFLAVAVPLFADIYLGIQVEAHKQGGSTGFGPLSLDIGIGAQFAFCHQHGDGFLEFSLDKVEDPLGLHLGFRVFAHIIVADSQRHVAEGIEQTEIEPGTQHTALGFEIVKLGL